MSESMANKKTTELGTEKRCCRCTEFFPMDDEFFYRRGSGFHSYCKACVKERCNELRSGAVRKNKPYRRGPAVAKNFRPAVMEQAA